MKTIITLIFLLSCIQSYSFECEVNYSSRVAVEKARYFLATKGLLSKYIVPEESNTYKHRQCEWLVEIKRIDWQEIKLPSDTVILVNKTTGKAKWLLFK